MYQKEWLGIGFGDFAEVTPSKLADSEFYNRFYKELFRRYKSYEELNTNWRKKKEEIVEWIANRISKSARILSFGCGLGYMEYLMHERYGNMFELHVYDQSDVALKWLQNSLPPGRIHFSLSPDKIARFDLIYLSAVDYAVPYNNMIELLSFIQKLLKEDGICLVISASYIENEIFLERIKAKIKEKIKVVLEKAGFYNRGQFWGWMRDRKEYNKLMEKAGYIDINDGFIETDSQRTYFIEGHNR